MPSAPAKDDQTLANNWAQFGANVPAKDYEAPSFGEGITPSSYEVKPNATNADIDAMQKELAERKLGWGADSLWEANKDSYADGGEVDHEPINAYHGSPHYIGEEGFQDKAIGTGEGAQAYGHGHYLAESEPIAQGYRDALSGNQPNPIIVNGERHYPYSPMQRMVAQHRGDVDKVLQIMNPKWEKIANSYKESLSNSDDTERLLNELDYEEAQKYRSEVESMRGKKVEYGKPGHMYQVAIHAHPDHFLDWDKPLSEQSEHVRNAVSNLSQKLPSYIKPITNESTGNEIEQNARWLGKDTSTAADASKALLAHGIRGIKYLDAGSRGAGTGSRNYVVFDPKDIEIMRRYAQGGDVSAWHPNHPLFGKTQGGEVYRNVNKLGLYSEGADIASQAKQPEQTPQQWQQYLSTRVKPDEMKWSGVSDMLANGSGKLHKDDVAKAFDHSNMNDYQENVYRGMQAPHARQQIAGPEENYREVVLQHKPEEEEFIAKGHYLDSNPLLHIRMSDRPHPEGGKVLHVQELQSDWGQKGRKKGFKDQSLQTLQKEYEDAVKKWKEAEAIHWPIYEKETEPFLHIPWYDPLYKSLTKPYKEKFYSAMDPFINAKIAAAEKLKEQKNKISPAPHVEDTNKWVDLGLKRILAEAAKGDYRGISFTSGKSQAAWWNNEERLIKPYDETIPSRMQKLMNQHDSSNQFQKYAIPFTEKDKFFSHYIPMSDKAADSIQKGQKRFKRGGYIPHHNPIVEQALNKTNIAPLDVMSLVKRSRGRP